MKRTCPSCPDGYVWDSNGPTGKVCPTCDGKAHLGEGCPKCGSEEIGTCTAMPPHAPCETTYKVCYECDHQWGHE